MDSINYLRMEEISKKSKHINLKSTSLINQINQQDKNKSTTYPIRFEQSTYNNNIDINYQQQQDTLIPQQPIPFNPYPFNKLSLISSLTTTNKQQSIQQSIQEKKLKYNERFKSKQINRQNFLNKMNQSLQKINMFTSVQIKDYDNCQQMDQDQNYSDQQNVSLTLSGDKPTTQRKFIKEQKDLSTQQKNLNNSQLKISIHQSKYQHIQTSNPNSKYQSIQKAQNQSIQKTHNQSIQKGTKLAQKVIIKRSNKQSLQTSQRFNNRQQSSNYKRTDNNNNNVNKISNKNNKQIDQKQQERKDIIGQNILRSKNEFMFLQQYQKDQKQIMNRLLNIIETQINNKKLTNQSSHYQSPFYQLTIQLIQTDQLIQTNQQKLNSKSITLQKQLIFTFFSQEKQISTIIFIINDGLGFGQKQRTIRQLQQNRKKKNKNIILNNKNQQQNKHILSQTVKINLNKNNQNINNLYNRQSQLSSLNQSKQVYDQKNKVKLNQFNQDNKPRISPSERMKMNKILIILINNKNNRTIWRVQTFSSCI